MNRNYQNITMKVAPEYMEDRKNHAITVAILKDARGYFRWSRYSLEEMYKDLPAFGKTSNLEVLAIYPDTNPTADRKINQVIDNLNEGKKSNLGRLLKSQ